VIMQRIHVEDFTAMLLEDEKDWVHLKIPAITEDGVALWPHMHTLEQLRDMEDVNSYVFTGQYGQDPTVIGGNMFKSHWWQFYQQLPKIRRRIIYADTAQKAKEENDFSVFQVWGVSYKDQLYLIDQLRGKWESPELRVMAFAFWNKHRAVKDLGILSAFKIEDKSSGTDLIQSLKRGKSAIPIVGIPRDTDKVSRANDVLPSIKAGNVFIPLKAPWLSEYLTEFEQFPSGTHDDQVDPTMDAITDNLGCNVVDYSKL